MSGTDPELRRLLKQIRENHGKTQEQIDSYMGNPLGTYRHIEAGHEHRNLPDPLDELPDGKNALVEWLNRFFELVQPTDQERKMVRSRVRHITLEKVASTLKEIESIIKPREHDL